MEEGRWTVPPTDANLNRISQEYSYQDILDATDNLSASSRLGEGTYGSVFRGMLRDGTEVAVKHLGRPHEAGFREEVEVLSRFRHPNLVILMGFARSARERYLVYELLPGGDVCARLQRDPLFKWQARLRVAVDAALGLSHLHGSRPQVFHRDIKTQNILMDRNGTGKMADFGLALLAQPNESSLQVEQTSGTVGYADPLYIRTGHVTERSEIYSFGMVLLEMLTRRPPALQHPNGRIEYQYNHLDGDIANVRAMVDKRAEWPPNLVDEVGALALRCTHKQEALRPVFVEVVSQLRQLLRSAETSFPSQSPGCSPAGTAHDVHRPNAGSNRSSQAGLINGDTRSVARPQEGMFARRASPSLTPPQSKGMDSGFLLPARTGSDGQSAGHQSAGQSTHKLGYVVEAPQQASGVSPVHLREDVLLNSRSTEWTAERAGDRSASVSGRPSAAGSGRPSVERQVASASPAAAQQAWMAGVTAGGQAGALQSSFAARFPEEAAAGDLVDSRPVAAVAGRSPAEVTGVDFVDCRPAAVMDCGAEEADAQQQAAAWAAARPAAPEVPFEDSPGVSGRELGDILSESRRRAEAILNSARSGAEEGAAGRRRLEDILRDSTRRQLSYADDALAGSRRPEDLLASSRRADDVSGAPGSRPEDVLAASRRAEDILAASRRPEDALLGQRRAEDVLAGSRRPSDAGLAAGVGLPEELLAAGSRAPARPEDPLAASQRLQELLSSRRREDVRIGSRRPEDPLAATVPSRSPEGPLSAQQRLDDILSGIRKQEGLGGGYRRFDDVLAGRPVVSSPERLATPVVDAGGYVRPDDFLAGGAVASGPEQVVTVGPPPSDSPNNKKLSDPELEEAKRQLQLEMGFNSMQVDEAFKRCSTAEGAIEWILSPERPWNMD